MTADRSPEDWEASDHIENLKAGIARPGSKISGVCEHHGSLALALIWIIRRMDKNDKSINLRVMLPAGGGAVGMVALIEIVKQLL